jgi:hypothetical protein
MWAGELVARGTAGPDGKTTLPLARGGQFEVLFRKADGTNITQIIKP